MHDLQEYFHFLRTYSASRLLIFGKQFERVKDVIVAFLIVKRGKYSTSILNTSFVVLGATAIIGGPVIAENNPFVNNIAQEQVSQQSAVVNFDPFENSLTTVVSVKPREGVIDRIVESGDTLDSLAKRYTISVNTIKWANNKKTDAIKPGEKLRIPPLTGVVHKVVSGDNIYSIAKKYKVDAQKILNFPFNDFKDLDTFALTVGQELVVPDGVIEEAKPVYAPYIFAQVQAGVHGSSNFIWPTTGIITQYPISYHMALDIANPSQPPIIASDTGTVVFAGCIAYGYGCHVIIDHGNGYRTLYGHMIVIDVAAGQVVNQGQKIGNMGSTGRSTGTHLHFEIRNGSTLMNPLSFLK
ncbi:MAG: peptidoglycan DD-metalloendopeptidase family protein [Candidatus Roizmanbacteria bacterium]